MPSADQVPINSTHSKMPWPMWVVLIAGSTGAALRAVRPPNLTSRRLPARSRSRRQRGGFLIALPLGHHRPGHSGELVRQRDRRDLGRSASQQGREPGPMFSAVYFGIADDGERTSGEQAAQITVALLADAAEPVLAPARAFSDSAASSRRLRTAPTAKTSPVIETRILGRRGQGGPARL